MLNPDLIKVVDDLLDKRVSQAYRDQPLAQHWARVAKLTEERGEAIAELILLTGQNPRKEADLSAYDRLLCELADVALGAVYAIQHFTKHLSVTEQVLADAQIRHSDRLLSAGE